MIGFDDSIRVEDQIMNNPPDLYKYYTHDLILSNDIPLIEGLTNLAQLRKTRFLFFGFPAKMGGLESFPIPIMDLRASKTFPAYIAFLMGSPNSPLSIQISSGIW
jgi:kynurenine formamidase